MAWGYHCLLIPQAVKAGVIANALQPKIISFGVHGDVSLAQSRTKRDEDRSMLAKGINPSEARKAEKLRCSSHMRTALNL